MLSLSPVVMASPLQSLRMAHSITDGCLSCIPLIFPFYLCWWTPNGRLWVLPFTWTADSYTPWFFKRPTNILVAPWGCLLLPPHGLCLCHCFHLGRVFMTVSFSSMPPPWKDLCQLHHSSQPACGTPPPNLPFLAFGHITCPTRDYIVGSGTYIQWFSSPVAKTGKQASHSKRTGNMWV